MNHPGLTESFAIGSALVAILMAGAGNLRVNLLLYSMQTLLVVATTVSVAMELRESHLYLIALIFLLLKVIGVPVFLDRILRYIKVFVDAGTMLPLPLTMHLSIALLWLSHFLASQLPPSVHSESAVGSTMAAISLLLTGTLFMLTRRAAVSQVIGFLTMENGIYLFALIKANGMPMMIELGILLDVLVGVMIAGLITFRIQKSFEHIDVSRLTELRD